jgi:hypothetical protein
LDGTQKKKKKKKFSLEVVITIVFFSLKTKGQVALEEMGDYAPTFIKGTLVRSLLDPSVDILQALEKKSVEESGRIQLGPLQFFSVDYGKKDPIVWIRSKEAFYRLIQPNKGYKEVRKIMFFTLCSNFVCFERCTRCF